MSNEVKNNFETENFNIFRHTDYAAVRRRLDEMNPVDIAELFEKQYEEADKNDTAIIRVFRMLQKDTAAEIFAYLSGDVQQDIVSGIKDHEIQSIVDEMFLDDAVDFVEEMPAFIVKRVLANLPQEKRELINHFLNYPENSVGSIMTNEYIDLKEHLTVAETFAKIRAEGLDKETIYTCYIVDTERRLVGAVSVRTLLLSELSDRIGGIMEHNIISAVTTDDKEEIANDFRKYGMLAMPVVDNENRLVGIVTVDDVMEIQEEEATEDFELMAAMSPSEEPYMRTSVINLTKHRLPWLLLLMLSASVTGYIISGFEAGLAVLPALVSFIPMLMDTGGNSGSQSSTLIIRGMAVEEIALSDILRVLWKELRVAALCGGILAVVNFIRILFMTPYDSMLAITVSITLFLTVILAKVIGSSLPMAAKKMRLDPAVMASPVITTIVDAGSLVLFFRLSKVILRI